MPTLAFLLARRWQMSDVGSISFCSSGRLNCQRLVRCWSNALSPASPACANVIPTIPYQVSCFRPTLVWHDLRVFVIETWVSLLIVVLHVTIYSISLSRNIALTVTSWYCMSKELGECSKELNIDIKRRFHLVNVLCVIKGFYKKPKNLVFYLVSSYQHNLQ